MSKLPGLNSDIRIIDTERKGKLDAVLIGNDFGSQPVRVAMHTMPKVNPHPNVLIAGT